MKAPSVEGLPLKLSCPEGVGDGVLPAGDGLAVFVHRAASAVHEVDFDVELRVGDRAEPPLESRCQLGRDQITQRPSLLLEVITPHRCDDDPDIRSVDGTGVHGLEVDENLVVVARTISLDHVYRVGDDPGKHGADDVSELLLSRVRPFRVDRVSFRLDISR